MIGIMTAQLISFPFRLNPQGSVVTQDDMSAGYCAGSLAIVLGTQPGEKVMVPLFGINDPAFQSFASQALNVQITMWGIPVDINDVKLVHINDAQQNITISYDMSYGGGTL
jgi:phage baseplate assembly protein W